MSKTKTKGSKRQWSQIYKGPVEDFDSFDSLKYWVNRSPAEKFHEVSDLIRQARILKGEGCDEPRLLRTTAVLRKT